MRPHGTIETSSRIKAWYLTTFAGRRILSIHSRPIVNMGNSVVYRRSFVLIPSDTSTAQDHLSAA